MSLIVVGIDGSEPSRRALDWAVGHAAETGATVDAVMVVDPGHLDRQQVTARVDEAERTVQQMVDEVVEPVARAVPVIYEVAVGDPADVLVQASRRADLIVFGSHRMSTLRNAALGTVSLDCIRRGGCPVLVIPPGLPEPDLSTELIPA